jgi:hypothetical protein
MLQPIRPFLDVSWSFAGRMRSRGRGIADELKPNCEVRSLVALQGRTTSARARHPAARSRRDPLPFDLDARGAEGTLFETVVFVRPWIVASVHRRTIAAGPPRRGRSGMSARAGSARAVRRAIHQATTGRVTGPIVRAAHASWPPTTRTSSPRAVRDGIASRRRSIATPGASPTPPEIAPTPADASRTPEVGSRCGC